METDIIGATVAQVQSMVNAALATALPPATTIATVRPLNSVFQPSTAHDTLCTYSVQITVTASIASGQSGDVIFEIASDAGFTLNVQTLSIIGNSQTFSLAVALQGVQAITGVLQGIVPQSMYARLRTVNNTGTPGYTYRAGQEVNL